MTKDTIAKKAKVLIETALQGVFKELNTEFVVSGDMSPGHLEAIENSVDQISETLASNVLFNLNNEPQETF